MPPEKRKRDKPEPSTTSKRPPLRALLPRPSAPVEEEDGDSNQPPGRMTTDGPIVQQRPSLGPPSLRPTQHNNNPALEYRVVGHASQIPPGSVNRSSSSRASDEQRSTLGWNGIRQSGSEHTIGAGEITNNHGGSVESQQDSVHTPIKPPTHFRFVDTNPSIWEKKNHPPGDKATKAGSKAKLRNPLPLSRNQGGTDVAASQEAGPSNAGGLYRNGDAPQESPIPANQNDAHQVPFLRRIGNTSYTMHSAAPNTESATQDLGESVSQTDQQSGKADGSHSLSFFSATTPSAPAPAPSTSTSSSSSSASVPSSFTYLSTPSASSSSLASLLSERPADSPGGSSSLAGQHPQHSEINDDMFAAILASLKDVIGNTPLDSAPVDSWALGQFLYEMRCIIDANWTATREDSTHTGDSSSQPNASNSEIPSSSSLGLDSNAQPPISGIMVNIDAGYSPTTTSHTSWSSSRSSTASSSSFPNAASLTSSNITPLSPSSHDHLSFPYQHEASLSMVNNATHAGALNALSPAPNGGGSGLQMAQQHDSVDITDVHSHNISPDSGASLAASSSPSPSPSPSEHPTIPTAASSSSSWPTVLPEGGIDVPVSILLLWLVPNVSSAFFTELISQLFLLPNNNERTIQMLRETAVRHGVDIDDVHEFLVRAFRGAAELWALGYFVSASTD